MSWRNFEKRHLGADWNGLIFTSSLSYSSFHFHLDNVHSVLFDLWTLITQNSAFKQAYIRKDQQISSLPMLSFIRRLMFLEEIYLILRYGNTFMIPLSKTSDTRHGKSVFPKCVYLHPHFWGDNGSKWVVRAKEIMPQLRVFFFHRGSRVQVPAPTC